jgi:hypothetical protein
MSLSEDLLTLKPVVPERAEEFDWGAVEHPADVAMEELKARGMTVTREQAAMLLQWAASRGDSGAGGYFLFLEALIGWVCLPGLQGRAVVGGPWAQRRGGEKPEMILARRVALRALLACKTYFPHMPGGGWSYRVLAKKLGISRGLVLQVEALLARDMGKIFDKNGKV